MQRFENYCKAFDSLKKAILLNKERDLSELEKQGVIQGFEFTFELAWKVVKDYLEYMDVDVKFPREVIKKDFNMIFLMMVRFG